MTATQELIEVLALEVPCDVYDVVLWTLVDSCSSLLFFSFWRLRISFLVKTGGVVLLTGHTGQPPLTITRHVALPQASETKSVFLNKIQFVFACLHLKLYACIQQMASLFAEWTLQLQPWSSVWLLWTFFCRLGVMNRPFLFVFRFWFLVRLSFALSNSFTAWHDEIGLHKRSASALMKVVKVLKSGCFFCSFIFLVASLFHRETSQSGNLVSSFWFSM